MNLLAILSNIGVPDVLDILFISFVAYQLYIWFSGTKAFKALIGIILLSGIYLVAESWGLFLTTWVFQILWQVFVILLIILFQREIRQMLERFNPLRKFGYRHGQVAEGWIQEFSKWAFEAAKKKMGVLIVFERSDLVFDLITKGIPMESDPVPEVLNSIFIKESPLHDGASLISKGKILKAACFLPLSVREDLPQEWGTRHRAALGLSERSDACVLIVSEERGEVSLAVDQKIEKIDDQDQLVRLISEVALSAKEPHQTRLKDKIKAWVTFRFTLKLAVFACVFILWLMFAGQQNFEKRMELPLTFKNIPADLVLPSSNDPMILITCRGLRKDISLLNKNNISASVDLFSARPGTHFYQVSPANLTLPNDRIQVVHINPSKIELTFTKESK
ncbi:MAG: diadenylate cyclase [Pseudomonadota bacterium]